MSRTSELDPMKSALGAALLDVPEDAELILFSAFYQNDREDGLGFQFTDVDWFPSPVSVPDGTPSELVEKLRGYIERKDRLTESDAIAAALTILSLELRGGIVPDEHNGCAFAWIKDGVAMMVRGDRPPQDVLGKVIGHGPHTEICEFERDD